MFTEECFMAEERMIRLKEIQDVHEFVKLADACDFDVNIGYDRISIDAKSIVGVMGLDLGRPLRVDYDGKDEALAEFLKKHEYVKTN